MDSDRGRIVAIIAVIAAVMAGVVLYWLYDPSDNFYPKCHVYMLTGYMCPGCGSQRAFHALLHGRVAEAWHWNAMLFFIVPVIMLMGVSEFYRSRYPGFNNFMTSGWMAAVITAAVLAWGVLRNILSSPV